MTKPNRKLILVHLEIVLILMQDKCTVCVERTIGSDIVLDTPDGTLRWVMWHLSSFCLETVLLPV